MIVIVRRKFFLPDYDYDYDCYSVKKTDYDYDYSEKNRNRLPNRLPIEGDYTSLLVNIVPRYGHRAVFIDNVVPHERLR